MRRRLLLSTALPIALAWASVSCSSVTPKEPVTPMHMSTDARQAQAAFNDNAHRPRVVALVSPSCGACLFGACAVRKLTAEADVLPIIIWCRISELDDVRAARRASLVFEDGQALQFYDGNAELARASSPMLFGDEVELAWDAYLFYEPGVIWESGGLPAPTEWVHQLGSAVDAEAEHFKTGDDTLAAMQAAVQNVSGLKTVAPAVTRAELSELISQIHQRMETAFPTSEGAIASSCARCRFDPSKTLCPIGDRPKLVFEPVPEAGAQSNWNAMHFVEAPVLGMQCGGCMYTLAGVLAPIPYVRRIELDLDKQTARVGLGPAGALTVDQLSERLRLAGY